MVTRHKINARVVLFDEVEVVALIESSRILAALKDRLSLPAAVPVIGIVR